MKGLFDNIILRESESNKISVRIGIRLQVGGNEVLCPVSRPCDSLEAFERECRSLSEELELMKEKASKAFGPKSFPEGMSIGPDASAEDVWKALSVLQEEEMVRFFNELEPSQRRSVAEHVLTHCNVFSGKGAVFSRRYDAETGLME